MPLYNDVVPKYYGIFREKVLAGLIPVNKYICMQMELIDQKIENPGIYYDPEPVEAWIRFCESEMVKTDGTSVEVLESFKLWAEDLLCWFYFVEREVYVPDEIGGHYELKRTKYRLTKEQYLIVGRGAAKSVYLSYMQSYGLICDITTTNGVVVAPTMRLADETMTLIKTAITVSQGPLFKFLTAGSIQNTTGNKANRPKLWPTSKNGIVNFLTNSNIEVRPMRIDKLQGLRCKYATLDEWLSGDTKENPIEAISQGGSKIKDSFIIASSSEGTVRNGVGDTIKMESLLPVLSGEVTNPHLSIWWYALDDISEVANPAMWIKANPNIGITVSYESYQMDVEKAERIPSVRNDILAKRFGLPMEGYVYFFRYEDIQPHDRRVFWGLPCSMGADMSRGDDFCAFDFLFPLPDGTFGLKTRCYITTTTLSKIPGGLYSKYQSFMDEGSLIVMEGTVLNMLDVYDDLNQYILESDYDVRTFGFDPYNAKAFVERWTLEFGDFGVDKVIQGARTESVPLGEIKTLTEERMLIFDQQIVTFSLGNAITIEDTNGNRKLAKERHDKKIDVVAALVDAYVAFKQHPEMFE